MRIFDPLYGMFYVSQEVGLLAATPEVRRLSQVRLLNTLSPSLATLGEVRRYSHTLGVLYLAAQNEFLDRAQDRLRAFQAAILLHDIGTPPFGHLLEYHLKDRYDWHHEKIVGSILWGGHAPENTAHQIFGRQVGRIRRVLEDAQISIEAVQAILEKRDPLGRLLSGTLDLDNLDNVARMAHYLGRPDAAATTIRLARSLSVTCKGELALPIRFRDEVRQWLRVRRWVYGILTTDGPTLAAQAVLSAALGVAIEGGHIGVDDWALSDEELVERLLSNQTTKKLMVSYLGRLPQLLVTAKSSGSLQQAGFRTREELHTGTQAALIEATGDTSILCYVFVDRGAFERRLDFVDPTDDTSWSVGESSSGVFVYVFGRGGTALRERVCGLLETILNGWAIDGSVNNQESGSVGQQPTFDFEAPTR